MPGMKETTPYAASPGRPREFDMEVAVHDAMDVFWTHGYHATSLTDLLAGTGLSRGSLYKAFGDKKSLFLQALDCYAEAGLEELSNTLSMAGPVKDAIRAALSIYVPLSAGPRGRRGCMVMATAAEMLPHDPEVGARVQEVFRRIQALLDNAVRRGQAAEEIGVDQDSRNVARFLVCQIEGMRLLGKVGASRQDMAAVVEAAMRCLD